jgi:hypothetical protein
MNSLRVCQSALNKLMHQSLDIINKLGVPRIIQSRNAPLHEKDRHNLPGVWEHNPTGRPFDEPRPWPALQPPPGMYQLIEMIISMMQQIAGWREGGMAGGAITGDTSGVAYQTLTGNDMARLESTARQLERGIERCLWLLMKNIKQFWTEERAVTVAGEGMETETIRFIGSMVSDEFEIRVIPQSSIPATKQATFQRALVLFQAGAFGDPMTPAARRELMKRVGEEEGEEATLEAVERQVARRENMFMLQNKRVALTPVQQMSLEDADLHVHEHLMFLFSPECQNDPAVWAAVYMHLNGHLMIANAQRMQAMTAMAPPAEGKESAGGEAEGPPQDETIQPGTEGMPPDGSPQMAPAAMTG